MCCFSQLLGFTCEEYGCIILMWFLFSAHGAASMGFTVPSELTPKYLYFTSSRSRNELKLLKIYVGLGRAGQALLCELDWLTGPWM